MIQNSYIDCRVFDMYFILDKTGKKIGMIMRVDDTTANVKKDPYIRLSVKVDLNKHYCPSSTWMVGYDVFNMKVLECKPEHKKYNVLGVLTLLHNKMKLWPRWFAWIESKTYT